MSLARAERAALSDTFDRTDPDQPTLCDGWSARDLLAHLRGGGKITGGPAPFQPKDRSRFLDQLEATIRAARRPPTRRD